MIEIDASLAKLAHTNAASNGWAERIDVMRADVADVAELPAGASDLVVCNPPFVGYFYAIPTEGSYLVVNKNLVELAALAVLFLTRSGHVAGLDRIIHGLVRGRGRLAEA